MFGPLPCLIVGVGLILFLILVLRFHAFLALTLSAVAIALLSDRVPAAGAIPFVAEQFGVMMGKIGLLLALAAIIGKCLMDSGAADRVVRAFNRLFGAGREEYSLFASGFVLSIPVFFDTVFYLLAPVARAAYARRKRDYVLLVLATAAGAAVTHGVIPPTPGPILVAETLNVSILRTIFVGVIASLVPTLAGGLFYAYWINRRLDAHPTDTIGVTQAELEAIANKSDAELPSLFASLIPFVLPVVLLTVSSIYALANSENAGGFMAVLGDKNFAFLIGAFFGIYLLYSQNRLTLGQTFKALESAIASGAVIAFITSAGGAFGMALAQAGIGDLIKESAQTWGIPYLLLAFLTAMLIRVAQGSATVAMTAAVGIIAPSIQGVDLGFHPVYLVPAIGFGATACSWMNDSGFWVFGQMTGLNEAETLKTWSVSLTLMGVLGFLWVCLLTVIMPMT